MPRRDFVPGTTILRPWVPSFGKDGNAYALLAKANAALRRAGVPVPILAKFDAEAKSGDYANLLRVCSNYITAPILDTAERYLAVCRECEWPDETSSREGAAVKASRHRTATAHRVSIVAIENAAEEEDDETG